MALLFLRNNIDLTFRRTHFHNEKECIWVPLILILKLPELFSFDKFTTMLKVYLGLRGGSVEVEIDIHEVDHHINIRRRNFIETAKDVYAPYDVVTIFFKKFPNARLHSLFLSKYVGLKIRVELADERRKKKFAEEMEK